MSEERCYLTVTEAIAFSDSGVWREWTPQQRAIFQLHQQLLCIPFPIFHEAVEQLLGRAVWTHEFVNSDALIAEYEGKRPAKRMSEIGAELVYLMAGKPVIKINKEVGNE